MNKSCITNICNLSLLLMIEYKGNEKKSLMQLLFGMNGG